MKLLKLKGLSQSVINYTFLALILLIPSISRAQATPAVPQPLESAWNVSVNGNFSSLQNQPTNNGVLISTALRLSTHWNLRGDTYIMQSPDITVVLAGPEYRFSLAHIFKNQSGALNPANIEGFVNAGLGDAHATVSTTAGSSVTTITSRKFAGSVGGGFDIAISPTVSIRPLDIKYIRSNMIQNGGTFLGNHLDFSAGLGLHF